MGDSATVCISSAITEKKNFIKQILMLMNIKHGFFFDVQILAALRKFGIPEWILVDEDWADFVEFLKENICNTNILTDEELVE